LIWAAEMGSVACAKMLLDAGTDPNKVEWDGWSALHWAARNGHFAVTKLLLEHRANLEQRDSKGLTPQDWAAGSGYCDVFEALEQHADYVRKSKLDSIMREKCSMSDTVVSGSVGDWKQISNDHHFSFGSWNEFGFDVH
jgi:ankyrin repeat protein